MNFECDIFLDESGLFRETSTDPRDRIEQHQSQGRRFASQIAGIVCPSGRLTEEIAAEILQTACSAGGIQYSGVFHSTEQKHLPGFGPFVVKFAETLQARGLQPSRIVNQEAVSFGDRVANYTNVLAEMLVRTCRTLTQGKSTDVKLHVHTARVVKSDDDGVISFFEQEEYLQRIREYFARAAVANGWSAAASRWTIGSFRILSARTEQRLQLADIVSNVSHDQYSTVDPDVARAMQAAMNRYDWTLSFDAALEHINSLAEKEAYAFAFVSAAERALSDGISEDSRRQYEMLVTEIVSQLLQMPSHLQTPQLQIIFGWLHRVVESRTDMRFALRLCKWTEKHLCGPNEHIQHVIRDWVRFVISTWGLTACNHDGNTAEAKQYSHQISDLIPQLAGRWEFASDLMRGLVAQSVHFNDCFDHTRAVKNMTLVAHYYQSLGGFFADVYPDVFPEKIRSDLCARALGTQVQSETFLLHAGVGDIEEVRQISDLAIEEFLLEDDKRRQYQYRSELEAIAEDWEAARRFLAMSLGINEIDHAAIAKEIRRLENPTAQGFALLHWTRIGGMAAVSHAQSEFDAFQNAWKREKLEYIDWVQGKMDDYPTHGILRRLATVYAAAGDTPAALQALSRLANVVGRNPRTVFRMIHIAAILQTAGLLARTDKKAAGRLLQGGKNDRPASKLIASLESETKDSQPQLAGIVKNWSDQLTALSNANADLSALVRLTREVGY